VLFRSIKINTQVEHPSLIPHPFIATSYRYHSPWLFLFVASRAVKLLRTSGKHIWVCCKLTFRKVTHWMNWALGDIAADECCWHMLTWLRNYSITTLNLLRVSNRDRAKRTGWHRKVTKPESVDCTQVGAKNVKEFHIVHIENDVNRVQNSRPSYKTVHQYLILKYFSLVAFSQRFTMLKTLVSMLRCRFANPPHRKSHWV